MTQDSPRAEKGERRRPLVAFAAFAAGIFTLLVLLGLGYWQVERLAWKRDLIARVESRVHAPAAPIPPEALWPSSTEARDAYRHVFAEGRLLGGKSVYTQAATELGGGYWLMTPLALDDGGVLFVNRGFVTAEWRRQHGVPPDAGGRVRIGGLLRMSEPGGGFLRHNDPANDRWYSRDTAAMAKARGLDHVAPFFIDAERGAEPGPPVAGLTVIRFPNNHLMYAITWFTLAALLAGFLGLQARAWLSRR